MGAIHCSTGCECDKDEVESPSSSIKEEPDLNEMVLSGEKEAASVESYNKLFSWLIQMSETDDETSDKSPKYRTGDNKKNHSWRQLFNQNSGSFESHCSSDQPYWGGMFISSASEEIPEEDDSDMPSKQSSFEVDSFPDRPTKDYQETTLRVPVRRGTLVKQKSVCDSQYSESDYAETRFDVPQIQIEESDNSHVAPKTRELNLLRARLQDIQSKKCRQRNDLIKQKSESCVDRIYRHDQTFLKRRRKAAASCDNINKRVLKVPSIQTQASEDDVTYSFSEADDQKNAETIPLQDMVEQEDTVDADLTSVKNRKNGFRERVSEFWSKSVGSMIGKGTRTRPKLTRKSNSLFTVQPSIDSQIMKDDIKKNFYSEKILDDKLLDANIADILFAVDAIWPKA
ncbi:uncharacterized protein LOC133183845 [Saccostrea echinata]|uniref:uncharacterized protein LOC133183845 n=1 Tax=Saccostrea echinata TaxID=191078 RepID=UPI002A83BECD|nr:uncharacterized protein LOC133183845 [Saccostrea echinata]